MIPIFIAIALLLGAGGTVAVSDAARPGDILFPVDQAVEDIRLSLTPEKSKVDLKIEFANERVDELESLLEGQATSSQSSGVSDEARNNLSHALDILTNHLAEIKGLASTTPGIEQAISVLEARLQGDADALPQELRIRVRDEGGRIELRTEDQKLKVKIDDGEIEVEFESEGGDDDDNSDDDSTDDDDDNSGRGSSSNSGSNATSTSSGDDDSDDDSDNNSGSGSGGNDSSDDDSIDDDEDSDDDSDDDNDDSDDDDNDNSGSGGGSPGSSGSN